MSLECFPLSLPRNAFGPRETARAGDLWRLLQEAAVLGSSRRGWTPDRYREAGTAFVVRRMTVVHHRESRFGEPFDVETWVSTFRRGMISNREIRISAGGSPVLSATQEWVHVRVSPSLAPERAGPELQADLAVVERAEPAAELGPASPASGPEHRVAFDLWHTWMDPLSHANHPAYVDWCDEAIARLVAHQGADPHGVVPVAEVVHFRRGAMAPERVTVTSAAVGWAGDALHVEHRILGGDGRLCAVATTVRRHLDGPAVLGAALGMVG